MANDRLVFSALEWTTTAPGARQKVFERSGKRVRPLEFLREFVEAEWCREAHVDMVLQGALELDFNHRLERFRCRRRPVHLGRRDGQVQGARYQRARNVFLVEDV